MFGAGGPLREEDAFVEGGDGLPDLDAIRQRIPAKTQVLMEELFRAKLAKVQRIKPGKIR